MKRSFIIGAAAAAALFASAPVYAGFGWNGVNLNGIGFNGIGFNGIGFNGFKANGIGFNANVWNGNQASAAGQPGLNLTFEGVTLSTGETVAAK